jgi:hypothetical protein
MLLSPAVVGAALAGLLPDRLDLAQLLKPFAVAWQKQQAHFLKRG